MFNGMDDSNTVTCLAQAGFQYPIEASGMLRLDSSCFPLLKLTSLGLNIAFSPNSCVAVTLDSDGQMQLRVMGHSFGSTEGLYDESMCCPEPIRLTELTETHSQILRRRCCFDGGILPWLWK